MSTSNQLCKWLGAAFRFPRRAFSCFAIFIMAFFRAENLGRNSGQIVRYDGLDKVVRCTAEMGNWPDNTGTPEVRIRS